MRPALIRLPFLALVLGLLPPATLAAEPAVTAIQCGRLIDVRSGSVASNAVVLAEGGKITAAGPDVAVPEGARVHDLRRATCLPGLIDVHTHLLSRFETGVVNQQQSAFLMYTHMSLADRALLGAAMAREMLEAGFTAVRDLGNSGRNGDVALRDAIRKGWVPGPRMAVSTRALAAVGGQFWRLSPEGTALISLDYAEVTGADEARRAVRQAVFDGAGVIKVIVDDGNSLSLDEMKAIVDEAHRAGLKVAAHVSKEEPARIAVEAGVDSLEHAFVTPDDLLRRMAEKKIYLVPTDFPADMLWEMFGRSNLGAEQEKAIREGLAQLAGSLRERLARAHKLGVPIAAGADIFHDFPGKTRGQASLQVYRSYIAAGLKPLDVLRAATLHAAELLGWQGQLGTLEPGRYADLIAVEGDPLEDVMVLEKVSFVMKGGAVVKPRQDNAP